MTKPTLPALPYEYNALEPWIDEQTMRLHHDKHHQTYLDNYLKAVSGSELEDRDVGEVISNLGTLPDGVRTAVRNNGGGFVNHSLFWELMAPNAGGEPSGPLAEAVRSQLGGFESFKERFSAAALGQFGSGWAWLALTRDGRLAIYSLPNQDSPLSQGDQPILGLDVWEHAYYLKYQNRRAEYVSNWWNVVNWRRAGEVYQAAAR